MLAIQYFRGVSFKHDRLQNIGSPGPVYAKGFEGLAVLGPPKL
jgi:hypothetical protein